MPLRRIGEWRYISTHSWRRKWVVDFTPRPLYPQRKGPWYPFDRRLGGHQRRSIWMKFSDTFPPLRTPEAILWQIFYRNGCGLATQQQCNAQFLWHIQFSYLFPEKQNTKTDFHFISITLNLYNRALFILFLYSYLFLQLNVICIWVSSITRCGINCSVCNCSRFVTNKRIYKFSTVS